MNINDLAMNLKSIDTLMKDGVVSKERGEILKERMIAKFEGTELSEDTTSKELPTDIAHFPGRLVGGIIKALGNINSERCAGVAPEQVASRKASQQQSVIDLADNLPQQYK